MRKWTDIIRLLCVQIAERSGWLFEVDDSIVDSYLYASGSIKAESELFERFSFPKMTLAALAGASCASLFAVAAFPTLGIDSLLATRQQQAIALYARIIQLQNTIEVRYEPLGTESSPLTQARFQLSEALVQLHKLQALQIGAPDKEVAINSSRIAAIREALKLSLPTDVVPRGAPSPKKYADLADEYSVNEKFLNQVRANLDYASEQIKSLPSPDYAYASTMGRRSISVQQSLSRSSQFPTLIPEETRTRLPDYYKDWNGFLASNGRPYDAGTVLKGDSLNAIPGGIVLGQTAIFEGHTDLSAFVLTYESETKRLALVGPKAEIYYSAPIEPETIKALNTFVTKGQTVAVSIGWGGRANPTRPSSEGERVILLDPTFVDTRVGQDLVRADSLPWEFSRPSLSGWPNPMARQFAAGINALKEETSSQKRAYLKTYKPDESKLRVLIDEIKRDPDIMSEVFTSCSIDPEEFELLNTLAQFGNVEQRMSAFAVLRKILEPESLATLYDKNAVFALVPGQVVLRSGLEYKYVTARVKYGDPILFGSCLDGSDVTALHALNKVVNAHISDILSGFQTVRSVDDYAKIAAFLRWAKIPGHLQAVDFYTLLDVRGHNEAESPTPDVVK